MAIQRGKDLLLKLAEAGTGTFVTVAGLRSRPQEARYEAGAVAGNENLTVCSQSEPAR